VDLLITTFEKCESLLRMGHILLQNTKVIIADEIHEMGSPGRGGRIEFMIMRLLKNFSLVQFIGLSATIANYAEFQGWLSKLSRPFISIHSDFRLVPLHYHIEQYKSKIPKIKEILSKYLINQGQVIIFVNRRKNCVKLSQQLSFFIQKKLTNKEKVLCQEAQNRFKLQKSLAPSLDELIGKGIGYHNASLNTADRHIIESLFLKKTLKVIVATSTLAAGINLPARAVIIPSFIQYQKHWDLKESDYHEKGVRYALNGVGIMKPLNPNMFFQMLGRAGRYGFDEVGHGFVLVKSDEERDFVRHEYFQPNLDKEENLNPRYASLKSQINQIDILKEILMVLINETPGIDENGIKKFLQSTFFAYLEEEHGNLDAIKNINKYLFIEELGLEEYIEHYGFTRKDTENWKFRIRHFTHRMLSASVIIPAPVEKYSSQFHVYLDSLTGLRCTCDPNHRFQETIINNPHNYRKMCSHATFIIKSLIETKKLPVISSLKHILANIFDHDYILPYLIKNRLIKITSYDYGYEISNLGRLGIMLYLFPTQLIKIRNLLKSHEFNSDEIMIQEVLDYHTIYSTSGIKNFKDIVMRWINEHTIDDILAHHPRIGVGDFFALKNDIERDFRTFSNVAMYLSLNESSEYQNEGIFSHSHYQIISDRFFRLSRRMYHGINDELVDMMDNLQGISRNRARILKIAGFSSYQQVLNSDPLLISHKTKIPLAKIMEFRGELATSPKQSSLLNFIEEE